MNDDIRTFLKSYQDMVETYRPRVAPDSVKLRETELCLAEMERLGESCPDIGQYLGRVGEHDYMNRMTSLLSDLATEGLAASRAGGETKLPSVADAALGYHRAYEAIQDRERYPETCRVYERVFLAERESAGALQFMRRMAEEGLFVAMAAVSLQESFAPLVGQADTLSLPSMAVHNAAMLAMAKEAASAIEVEYESQRLLELNRAELAADTMLCNDLFYTIGNAVSSWLISPTEENRERVENAGRFVAEFFGLVDELLFALPRVVDLIEKIILTSLNGGPGGGRFTRQGFIDEQRAAIRQCLQGRPPVVPGPGALARLVLWGVEVPLAEALAVFRNPPRPAGLAR